VVEPPRRVTVCQAVASAKTISPDVRRLHGRSILVRSTQERRNPETAVRGTIEVDDASGQVRVALEFPQMFTTRAHHRTIVLGERDLEQLVAAAGDRTETLQLTLEQPLDPAAPEGSE
jgi:hypothetical protein